MTELSEIYHGRVAGIAASGVGHLNMMAYMHILALLASDCEHVTEFGVNTGNSTCAFLYGLNVRGGRLVSYDLDQTAFTKPADAKAEWQFWRGDTRTIQPIEETDMLFIDTRHTYRQVRDELRFSVRVRKWLVFHDTTINETVGEHGEGGIWQAIEEFLQANPVWEIGVRFHDKFGLTILRRK